jgi:NAD(P)H dehydrogenase (quinone)
MHVYVIFAHPSHESFSRKVLDAFLRGLDQAGHTWEVGDLYRMGFRSEMDEAQYQREVSGNPDLPVPPDVAAEQAKLDCADGLAFIFPLWWSDGPAKLKGWFDRVLTCGYAYLYDDSGARHTRLSVDKAVVLCSAGHTVGHLEETGVAGAMRRIMIEDRLLGVGVKQAQLVILGGVLPNDNSHHEANLRMAYEAGSGL